MRHVVRLAGKKPVRAPCSRLFVQRVFVGVRMSAGRGENEEVKVLGEREREERRAAGELLARRHC